MSNKTYLDIKNIFKSYCEKHKATDSINNKLRFCRSMREFLKRSGEINRGSLIIDGVSGSNEGDYENTSANWVVNVIFLQAARGDSEDEIEACYDNIFNIANEYIARLIKDREDSDFIQFFVPSGVSWKQVDNIADGYYGWRFSIIINQPNTLAYDASKWNS